MQSVLVHYRDLYTHVGDSPDVECIIRQASEDGLNVIILTPNKNKRKIAFNSNVKVIRYRSVLALFKTIHQVRDQFGVAHLFCGWIPSIPLIIIFLKIYQKKVIYSPFGQLLPLGYQRAKYKKKLFYSLILKPALKVCSGIHVSSNYEYQNLGLAEEKKVLSFLPIKNLCKVRDRPLVDYKYSFLFFGRLDIWHKGLDILIPALAAMHNKYPKMNNSIIAGRDNNNDTEHLLRLISMYKCDDKIELMANVSAETRRRLYSEAQYFAHPSRLEGFARSMRDAISEGLPVVTSYDSNADEVLRILEVGEICEFDISSLTQAMERLIQFDVYEVKHRYQKNIKKIMQLHSHKQLLNFYRRYV